MADSETAASGNPAADESRPRASAAAQMDAFENPPAEAPDPDDPDIGEEQTVAQSSDASAAPFSPPPTKNTEPANVNLETTGADIGTSPKPSVKSPPAPAALIAPSSIPSAKATAPVRQDDLPIRQGTAPVSPGAIIAGALASRIQRPQTQPQPAASAASHAVSAPQALLDRFAVKQILDTLRPKAQTSATSPTAASAANSANPRRGTDQATRIANAPAPAAAPAASGNVPQSGAAAPVGGLRDKFGAYTAKRMQPRRDAEQVRGVAQAAANVLASLQAVEQRETTGILTKIHDAAKANGGIENVLSEMRPGGQFDDLRKEFNAVLSHDQGFADAYQKATGAIASYADTRMGMTAASRTPADPNLARLETLDAEIADAAKRLPGVAGGKSAFDELIETGKEAVQTLFSNVQQIFRRDARVRGPSPSPGFGS